MNVILHILPSESLQKQSTSKSTGLSSSFPFKKGHVGATAATFPHAFCLTLLPGEQKHKMAGTKNGQPFGS